MNSYVKYCYEQGMNYEEYKKNIEYLKSVASNIVENHLKKDNFHNTGVYQDISMLNSLIPQATLAIPQEYNQLIIELKKLGVEFYGKNMDWRY